MLPECAGVWGLHFLAAEHASVLRSPALIHVLLCQAGLAENGV